MTRKKPPYIEALLTAFALLPGLASAFPALNPDVSQATIRETICRPGYSSIVRPSTTFTNPIKLRLMSEAGIPTENSSKWALDHRIAIGLGGHPRQLSNLQLLTTSENSRKSRIEVKLLCFVCTNAMPLRQAQEELALDWQKTYQNYAQVKCRR